MQQHKINELKNKQIANAQPAKLEGTHKISDLSQTNNYSNQLYRKNCGNFIRHRQVIQNSIGLQLELIDNVTY